MLVAGTIMSKSRKSNKKRTSNNSIADVTINDYANSAQCINRTKKYSANVMKVVEKEKEKSWDEKLDDYDGDFVEKVGEDGTVMYVIEKSERRRKKMSESEIIDSRQGNTYHIDIWFLISEYIKPEDVGRFAGICKTSYEVVCTEKFWYGLYKRYYKGFPVLPEKLRPECLLRKYSLKTSVIRALHYMYPPFVQKLQRNVGSSGLSVNHPNVLLNSQCVSMWRKTERKRCKRHYAYFFKMKVRNSVRKNPENIFELLDDISANQEEDVRVLKVCSTECIPIIPVLGLTLKSAQLTLSSGLSSYKLEMWFDTAVHNSRSPSSDGTCIVLDRVIDVLVLDWWHPLYPYPQNELQSFNQE